MSGNPGDNDGTATQGQNEGKRNTEEKVDKEAGNCVCLLVLTEVLQSIRIWDRTAFSGFV